MALTVSIGGTDYTDLARVSSLRISDTLNSRNTATLTIQALDGASEIVTDGDEVFITDQGETWVTGFRPVVGQAITIKRDAVTVFAGTIDEITEERLDPSSLALLFHLALVDNNQLADRRLVADVYEGMTAGAIAQAIVSEYLADDGVTAADYIDAGPTIDRAVFNYLSASNCFDELAELTGYAWWIDYEKKLHFQARESNVAPWAVTGAPGEVRDLTVTTTREQYRNKQVIRAGFDTTDERTETFVGDGERRTFVVAFPLAKAPTIRVDGVPQTVGIKGVDTGKQWYWNKERAELTQDDGETALTASNNLAITYQGLFPLSLTTQSDTAIAERQAIEGGSGVYEAIEDAPNIDNQVSAIDGADALIRRFGRIPRIVEYETDNDGLAAGQLQPIGVEDHALTGDWLIERVTVNDRDGKTLVYRVRALDGESLGGWQRALRRMTRSGTRFAIRENEVLTASQNVPADTVSVSDSVSYTLPTIESRVGYGAVGYLEIA